MRTFSPKSKATQQTSVAPAALTSTHFGHGREVTSILHLQRTIGNKAVQRLWQTDGPGVGAEFTATSPGKALQTKLAINKPGDSYEQEADRVSEQVMRMPEPRVQRTCACGGTSRNVTNAGRNPCRCSA